MVYALIPARGGSKAIPRKNVRPIAGKPLIVWTIEVALHAPGIDAVYVSTDDEETAEIARAAGAVVPFMRPAALARDDTPGIDPVLHALDMLPPDDAVMLLQPTSPLRTVADVTGVLALARSRRPTSIVSLCEPADHPAWMYRLDADRQISSWWQGGEVPRRQDLPPLYALNGAIYYARTDWLAARCGFVGDGTLGYVMTDENSVDIDGPLDWKLAELLLIERHGPA